MYAARLTDLATRKGRPAVNGRQQPITISQAASIASVSPRSVESARQGRPPQWSHGETKGALGDRPKISCTMQPISRQGDSTVALCYSLGMKPLVLVTLFVLAFAFLCRRRLMKVSSGQRCTGH